MEIWEAIVLGVLQGLTEFLPVSSSGHLVLASDLLGVDVPDSVQFTVVVHGATVLSTIVVFARELWRLIGGVFKFKMNDETVFVVNLIISMVPVAFVGLMLGDDVKGLFENVTFVGAMLLVTAALLAFAHYAKPRTRPVTPKSAFIIGLAQAVAVLPGLSRSGATISTGLMLGVKREEVSKFSFLMVLAPVIGANIIEALKMQPGDSMPAGILLAGFLSAFIVGTLACRWMIRIVNRGKLIWFAVYCAVVGTVAVVMNFV